MKKFVCKGIITFGGALPTYGSLRRHHVVFEDVEATVETAADVFKRRVLAHKPLYISEPTPEQLAQIEMLSVEPASA